MMRTVIFISTALLAFLIQNVESRAIRAAYRNPEENRINEPAQYRGMWSVPKFGTKYQAPNMQEEENRRIENNIHSRIEALKNTVKREVAEEESMRRYNYNNDISRTAEQSLSSNNDAGNSFSSYEYQDEAEEKKRIENSINSLIEALKNAVKREVAKDKSIRRHNYNNDISRTADQSISQNNDEGNSFSSYEYEDEAEENMRIENNIHSRIEALKNAAKREAAEEESTRRYNNNNNNKYIRSTAEQPVSRNNDAGNSFSSYEYEDEAGGNMRIENNIHSRIEALKNAAKKKVAKENKIIRTPEQFLSHNNYAGDSFGSTKYDESEYEDDAEWHRRIENNIQSRIEALKEDIKKEIAKGKIKSRNKNTEVKRKSEESQSHNNDRDDIMEELQNFNHPYKSSSLHGKGGGMAYPAVLMNVKTAIINIQDGKNRDSNNIRVEGSNTVKGNDELRDSSMMLPEELLSLVEGRNEIVQPSGGRSKSDYDFGDLSH
ncbi:GATA zinc finger domain-containing protein 14-like isoform X2 [Zootermopsis nevadensis]|uniref:GATA zinc finger domain-containing protein 14-like isoform X2 n=1 Tax=Zootermopsis nevadensis TaxID=136037 RepID=UPI000B8E4E0F|nr:GATA zinc finger domain-containing protein 14-like isoform X2 [Zootermopsis nevadensis]